MTALRIHTVDDSGTILTADRSVRNGCAEIGIDRPGFIRLAATLPVEDMIRLSDWLRQQAQEELHG